MPRLRLGLASVGFALLTLPGTGLPTLAAEPPRPAAPLTRDAAVAKLKANGVSLDGLTIEAGSGGPFVSLGVGPNGNEASNANDENLALVAQLPEVERILLFKSRFTKAGLAQLAALPKLRSLQIYAPNVTPDAFAGLASLTQLKTLSLGDYPVTDEVLGYAGQVRGLKSFDQTRSALTPAGFLKFLNAVESLEQLTLFGDFVEDAALQRVGEMKGMTRLWTDSKAVTPKAWGALAGLTKMKDLNFSKTSLDDDGARAVGGMKGLESLLLNRTAVTDRGLASLAGLTGLRDLGLDGTRVTDAGMANLKGMTELQNLYVGDTDVTAKGLAVVPRKDRMVMMRSGRAPLPARQLDEMMRLYPSTQLFDPAGYWTPERVKAAMQELGQGQPTPKK